MISIISVMVVPLVLYDVVAWWYWGKSGMWMRLWWVEDYSEKNGSSRVLRLKKRILSPGGMDLWELRWVRVDLGPKWVWRIVMWHFFRVGVAAVIMLMYVRCDRITESPLRYKPE